MLPPKSERVDLYQSGAKHFNLRFCLSINDMFIFLFFLHFGSFIC